MPAPTTFSPSCLGCRRLRPNGGALACLAPWQQPGQAGPGHHLPQPSSGPRPVPARARNHLPLHVPLKISLLAMSTRSCGHGHARPGSPAPSGCGSPQAAGREGGVGEGGPGAGRASGHRVPQGGSPRCVAMETMPWFPPRPPSTGKEPQDSTRPTAIPDPRGPRAGWNSGEQASVWRSLPVSRVPPAPQSPFLSVSPASGQPATGVCLTETHTEGQPGSGGVIRSPSPQGGTGNKMDCRCPVGWRPISSQR